MKDSRILRIWVMAALVAGIVFLFSGRAKADPPICGNAKVEGYEECDNGQNNSDSAPNGCRTNCVKAKCGDYGVDSGEECDEGPGRNSDKIPNNCRTNCQRAHCGDAVLDTDEECDDGNSNAYDGCHQCQKCYAVKDDLVLSGDQSRLKLCPGNYETSDSGQEGVLILAGEGMIFDCNGASIIGIPPDLAAKAQIKVPAAGAMAPKSGADKSKSTKPPQMAQPAAQPPTPGKLPGAGQVAQILQGTAIVIQAKDVVLHNCAAQKFKTGVRLKSAGAILFNNRVCGNSNDIVADTPGNFGLKNTCKSVKNWQENGAPACMSSCGN